MVTRCSASHAFLGDFWRAPVFIGVFFDTRVPAFGAIFWHTRVKLKWFLSFSLALLSLFSQHQSSKKSGFFPLCPHPCMFFIFCASCFKLLDFYFGHFSYAWISMYELLVLYLLYIGYYIYFTLPSCRFPFDDIKRGRRICVMCVNFDLNNFH